MILCTFAGCFEQHHAKGYCRPHYVKWKRHGDPELSYNKIQTQDFLEEYQMLRSSGWDHKRIATAFGIQQDSLVTRLRRIEKRKQDA